MRPIQSYNGYDNPWAGGMGSNQLDFDSAALTHATVSGTADDFTLTTNANGRANIEYMLPSSFAGRTLYMSGTIARTGTSVSPFAVQLIQAGDGVPAATTVATYTDNAAELTDVAVTPNAAATSIKIRVLATGSNDTLTDPPVTVHAQNLRLCVEQGQSWSPYANICPIYGHTAATAYRTNANIVNAASATGVSSGTLLYDATTDSLTVSGDQAYSAASINVFLKAGVRYGFSATAEIINGTHWAIGLRRPTGTTIAAGTGAITESRAGNFAYTPSYDGLYKVVLFANYGTAETATVKFTQVFGEPRPLGTPNGTYTPYQGDTYTVSFGQTVYGGTLDFVTGVLTATWGYIASYNGETLPAEWISDRDVYSAGATPTTGAAVAYKLTTPQTIQVTPQEITTLLGTNNIWAATTTNEP